MNVDFFDKLGHIMIIACTMGGKTVFTKYLYKLLKQKYNLSDDDVYVFTRSIHEWIEFSNVSKEDRLEYLYKKCDGDPKFSRYNVVFDDFTEHINCHLNEAFIKFFTVGRHKGIRNFMLVQHLHQVGPKIRTNCRFVCISTAIMSNKKDLRLCAEYWMGGDTIRMINYLKKAREKIGEYAFLMIDTLKTKYDAGKAPDPKLWMKDKSNIITQEYKNAEINKNYNNSGFFHDQSITNIAGDINAKTLLQRNKVHNQIKVQNIKIEHLIKINENIDRMEELCYKNYPSVEDQQEIVRSANRYLRPVPLFEDSEWMEARDEFIKWSTKRNGVEYVPKRKNSKILSLYNGIKNIKTDNKLELMYGSYNFLNGIIKPWWTK
jgi:hypothetical protein